MEGLPREVTDATLVDLSARELQIRACVSSDCKTVKEFILNNLMQQARMTNHYIYRSLPLLSVYFLALAFAIRKYNPWHSSDWGRFVFLVSAFTALFLVSVDYPVFYYYERKTKTTLQHDSFLQNPEQAIKTSGFKCWVATYGDALVAVLVLRSIDSNEAEIPYWFVRSRYRHSGLGGDLMNEALQYARTTKDLDLVKMETSTINARANKTLQRFGFEREKGPNDNKILALFRIHNLKWLLHTSGP
ncbi:acyl-CoA N-acyltransferase [Protomyces lactucae-debilis]|uniref:Acyl-CoA N-acyltransferase n=1 Tax=Protomyces lactucae-debilis TaxID=2754530 RepID=A0A1Y2FW58_PROLT|nr:acyl-CoA N-acyltransferase [Protomyces lactucae-debilis]ORY87777.1 acyl-CoA N-acyltransferase [Protomyces lactucae-debilis]